ncbi:hypothetical protein [Gloeocapsa sp. PCC 73106]|uniref:hypothetical protein n=1 Tax=Gloeocapsa sp. PCC 73106 TaxID=102232 RepID=UPI0002ABFF4C|nr:hypothetical protein [Gloeocapsa sp. PCC 73106]ELR96952.1 hypothetical protein GLO73106DRAFT_00007530 [Gloeocapsa sp. PCC 73106]
MSDVLKPDLLKEWLDKIEIANHHNIFCHCRACGWEWIDSNLEAICKCGSSDLETIACWQFPDD